MNYNGVLPLENWGRGVNRQPVEQGGAAVRTRKRLPGALVLADLEKI